MTGDHTGGDADNPGDQGIRVGNYTFVRVESRMLMIIMYFRIRTLGMPNPQTTNDSTNNTAVLIYRKFPNHGQENDALSLLIRFFKILHQNTRILTWDLF